MDRKNKLSRKKILCVSVMLNKGGGEEFLLQLYENITDYDFIIASPEGEAGGLFIRNGIKTAIINSLKKIYRGSGWSLYSFFRIIFNIKISTIRLLKLFRSEKPDFIISNGLFAALYNLPAVWLVQKKFIVVQHLIFNEESIENRVLKLVYRYAEKIVCVSEAVRENVLQLLDKSDSEKLIVIPNGINIPRRTGNSKINDGEVRIGMVGSIIRIKGINLVIKALQDTLKENNSVLNIYGSVSNDEDSVKYRTELIELIENYGMGNRVFLKGYMESRDEIYPSLDIVVNFSIIPEALPFSILEAMAYERIIIAASSGGSKEVITDSENGFLVEPGNLELLKERVEFCIENINSEALNRIRTNAYERVKNHYSISKFVENYNNIFHSLIK